MSVKSITTGVTTGANMVTGSAMIGGTTTATIVGFSAAT
jgi:hypothetical protein